MEKKRKEDWSSYAKKVLQNSMLTGIPQIVMARNWRKKIFRTFVFIICVAGFIYQSLSFMWLYWQYDVVVDVQVSNPTYVVKPSFTICTPYGFKAKEFCEDPESESLKKEYNMNCTDLEHHEDIEICKCNSRLCDKNGNFRNLTILTDYRPIHLMPRSIFKKWMLTPIEVMPVCAEEKMREEYYDKCRDDYYIEVPHQSEYEPDYCFTMNSMIGRPNKSVEKILAESKIKIQVNMHGHLVIPEVVHNKWRLSFHNPYTIVNPFAQGYSLHAGHRYTFYMKQVEKKLLPHPYKTNCKDYKSEWFARGGRGPTNLRECIFECQKNISLAENGCVLQDLVSIGDELKCAPDNPNLTLFTEAIACADTNCGPACEEQYYIVSEDIEENAEVECYGNEFVDEPPDKSRIIISLDGMETTTYSYSPKYQDIEIFSYLGGYMGMWLGISLVAFFDFVETVLVLLKYPMRRIMSYNEKRKKWTGVQKIHHNF